MRGVIACSSCSGRILKPLSGGERRTQRAAGQLGDIRIRNPVRRRDDDLVAVLDHPSSALRSPASRRRSNDLAGLVRSVLAVELGRRRPAPACADVVRVLPSLIARTASPDMFRFQIWPPWSGVHHPLRAIHPRAGLHRAGRCLDGTRQRFESCVDSGSLRLRHVPDAVYSRTPILHIRFARHEPEKAATRIENRQPTRRPRLHQHAVRPDTVFATIAAGGAGRRRCSTRERERH